MKRKSSRFEVQPWPSASSFEILFEPLYPVGPEGSDRRISPFEMMLMKEYRLAMEDTLASQKLILKMVRIRLTPPPRREGCSRRSQDRARSACPRSGRSNARTWRRSLIPDQLRRPLQDHGRRRMSAGITEADRCDNKWLSKQRAINKIGAAVALCMAVGAAMAGDTSGSIDDWLKRLQQD